MSEFTYDVDNRTYKNFEFAYKNTDNSIPDWCRELDNDKIDTDTVSIYVLEIIFDVVEETESGTKTYSKLVKIPFNKRNKTAFFKESWDYGHFEALRKYLTEENSVDHMIDKIVNFDVNN